MDSWRRGSWSGNAERKRSSTRDAAGKQANKQAKAKQPSQCQRRPSSHPRAWCLQPRRDAARCSGCARAWRRGRRRGRRSRGPRTRRGRAFAQSACRCRPAMRHVHMQQERQLSAGWPASLQACKQQQGAPAPHLVRRHQPLHRRAIHFPQRPAAARAVLRKRAAQRRARDAAAGTDEDACRATPDAVHGGGHACWEKQEGGRVGAAG